MNKNFVAKQSIIIDAPAEDVWEALTTPSMIKEYLFGTDVESDFEVGNTITYRGEWKGEPYEDKGEILSVWPNKLLETTYWSSMSGTPDTPENYKKVAYKLDENNGRTKLTVTQENNINKDEKRKAEKNWKTALDSLKKLLEK